MELKVFTALLLLGLANAAPPARGPYHVTPIKKEYFSDKYVKYTGQHDIINIVVPLNAINYNALNFKVEDSNASDENRHLTVFFTEVDVDASGKRTYQGLYVLKDGVAKKILENGRDATAVVDDKKTVYLAASDGIYLYNDEDQSVNKYGSLTDNIISIAIASKGDVLYILTEDNFVYRVTDNGNNKEKLEDVKNAEQIKLDNEDNLFFYTSDKEIYVRTSEGIKEIIGLPINFSKAVLVKPPIIAEEGLAVVVDKALFVINKKGGSVFYSIIFDSDAVPTGFGPEATIIHYYAFNKKIYEFNLIALLEHKELNELKKYLGTKADNIVNLATEKRKNKEL
ncbi:uncharacterized protein LOC123703699 [Colias croceus]|uniref:uncharacterized protein LOC123703699 n=1 Tax=Colias crocea TaxID=72248 RepID=UPI001E280E37|nr:uncharacterized protein LOC123703699 [Colias croceus]